MSITITELEYSGLAKVGQKFKVLEPCGMSTFNKGDKCIITNVEQISGYIKAKHIGAKDKSDRYLFANTIIERIKD